MTSARVHASRAERTPSRLAIVGARVPAPLFRVNCTPTRTYESAGMILAPKDEREGLKKRAPSK